MAAPSMNELAERFADRNIGSIFVYTHEAHPGEHYPHHTAMEEKFRGAEALRDVLGVTRPILIDALDGECHRAWGGMPNMTWIVSKSGRPVYKADWTDAKSVGNALDFYSELPARRKAGERLVTFNVERLDYRNREKEAFYEGLERSGPRAVKEYDVLFGHTYG